VWKGSVVVIEGWVRVFFLGGKGWLEHDLRHRHMIEVARPQHRTQSFEWQSARRRSR